MQNKNKTEWIKVCDNITCKRELKKDYILNDDMIIGKPFRTMSTGDVINPFTGKKADVKEPISEKDLEEFARVFDLEKNKTPVIIDWNHGSAFDGIPEKAGALGYILDIWVEDINDGRGKGLYVLPAYNNRGIKVVTDNKGALWSSPEFILGDVFDRKEENKKIGYAQIFAIALTSRPMQSVDTIDSVKLSITGVEKMEKEQETQELKQEIVEESKDADKESLLKDEIISKLQEEIKNLKEEIEKLSVVNTEKESEKRSFIGDITNLRNLNAKLSEDNKKIKETLNEVQMEAEVNDLLLRGFILTAEVAEAKEAYKIKETNPIFWNRFNKRDKPLINLEEIGHNVATKEEKTDRETMIKSYCVKNGLDYRKDYLIAIKAMEGKQ